MTATTSKSHPALVVLDSGAAAGGDGGILYPSGNSTRNGDRAIPHGSGQHQYALCFPHYNPSGAGSSHPAVPRSASPLASSSRAYANQLLHSTNSSGNDTTKKLNRLSTSSSLSIITPPTTPKRPAGSSGRGDHGTAGSSGSTGRLKMALSASLAHNFNQKLAHLNDKWNDFSFLLLKGSNGGGGSSAGGGGGGGAVNSTGGAAGGGRPNVRNDSYHSIESAVTCTAADFEAGNFYHRESESESNQEYRTTNIRHEQQPSGSNRSNGGPSRAQEQRQRRPRLRSSRRNSASGDPKEFDMLVLKPIDTGEDDNESF